MNQGVMIDRSLWDYQREIQRHTWTKKLNEDYDVIFNPQKMRVVAI